MLPATTSNNSSSSSSRSSSAGDLIRPHMSSQQQQLSFQVIPMIPAAPTNLAMSFSHHHHMNNTLSYLPFRQLTSPSSFSSPIEFRPSRPPHSPGLWFILQASQTQTKEPYLPQLPKSYLRIKDGKTTVGLLLKYLVYKLKLDGEFEIEITCKGQQLLPFLSLQHVRDNIWNRPRNDVVFLNSSASSVDHLIMVLNYGRIA
ncbi:hypothetical protein M8C21_026940 [Ambrosia artemisiifolia]|uniref:Uncharacterized protein n=1 Tax=Ambrosia artemisiifolia TaxID=4212 RepID=A0AAD5BSC8_AMBAR|nr:hypothetical protein M8C21_026940 [Ambrosia artemisiifolia]